LNDILKRGKLTYFRLYGGKEQNVPSGKRWLICYGYFYHKTGSVSAVVIRDKKTNKTLTLINREPDTTATGYFSLFNTQSNPLNVQFGIYLMDDTMKLRFSANPDAYLDVVVLEF